MKSQYNWKMASFLILFTLLLGHIVINFASYNDDCSKVDGLYDSVEDYTPKIEKKQSILKHANDIESFPTISRYKFNCSNIPKIRIERKIGHGVTKQVFLGSYLEEKIAVKMVTRNVKDVKTCVKKAALNSPNGAASHSERHRCFSFPNMKLMKEILLLQQLSHKNLLKLVGYCVKGEETEATSLSEHGVVAVYEYALRFYISTIRNWPWKLRLTTAYSLADFLDYLQNSAMGSLRISDFKDSHFLLKDSHIKLTDLDDFTVDEPACNDDGECDYNINCLGSRCIGSNAKTNMKRFNDMFFKNLLFHKNSKTNKSLTNILQKLDQFEIEAKSLKKLLFQLDDSPV
ncbi:unnamed protein product [Dimorphilus gyrociliatus]|uniref:Protein kinase domain-containing protein n=1 Tax=Dimorphilus gyrociliatus TaxID=2664684 RepID=A0A7I8VHV5_9ANNE|nr:unnamed protein product [Dimorphilus gyrociliatus]